jgi:hypothetical protein
MAFTNIVRRVVTIADSIEANIPVIEGIRTDDLPTPCINVFIENAVEHHPQLADVFQVNITVRYEEHYGDATGDEVNENFKSILDKFVVNDLVDILNVASIHVFKASVTDVMQEVDNDLFLNQFNISILMERDA